MAEFSAGGAGRREEDRRARKEGTKLLKALGMGSLLKGGKSKEKLRREKERRRAEEQAAAARQSAAETRARQSAAREAMVRRCAMAERAKADAARAEAATERAEASTARAEAEADSKRLAAERAADAAARAEAEAGLESDRAAVAMERAAAATARAEAESDFKSVAAERALADRATEALEAERAAARARAQREAETERRCQATERALDGAQRKEQDLREQLRTKEWDLAEAERERARWHADSQQARSTAEAQRSRAQFYVTEAQRRDASGGNGDHRVRYLEAEVERLERERDLERERASRQARLTETQLRFAEAELGRTRETPNPGPTAADDPMRAVARDHPDGIAKEMLDGEEAVKNVDYATALNSVGEALRRISLDGAAPEATAASAGAAPTPAGPFSGSQSFSIGTSAAPTRGKSGRRILKAKRPPPAAVKAKRPPPVADLYMESTFEAGGAAVRIVGLSNHGLNGRRGRVALEQLQDLIDRGRMLVHVAHELLPFALENVRAEPGSEAELERLKAYIRQALLTAEAQNSQARWVSSPFLPWAPSPPDTTRPIPEEMNRRVLRDAEVNAAAERIAAMRDADAKRIVVDAELGRANPDSVGRLQRDWYTACLPAEDEWGADATSRPGPATWGWSSPAEQTPAAAAAPSAPAPPPAPRAPQPAVVQQTTYYSSSPSPQIYMPRPAPTPPRRSSSGGARMGTVLRNDGMPDRRYASPRPVTTSGRPDRRFSVNRPATSSARSSGGGRKSGGTRRK